MGLKTKIWAFPAAAAALAQILIPTPSALANSQSRVPPPVASTWTANTYGNGAARKCTPAEEGQRPECMSQADAFSTAGEQAAFVAAYQMFYGPYGKETNPQEREKALRETAKAIDDCINGRDCGAEKQEKVLKALVQYNMGQDVKRMMLTNNTNREAMHSIDNSGNAQAEAHGQGQLSQAAIERAVSHGKEYSRDQSDPIKPYQDTGKVVTLNRGTGTTKDPYFQIDETTVTHKIDDVYLREREILGEKFLSDYAVFLDDFTATDDRVARRFYKYVPAKTDGNIHVYQGQGSVIDCYTNASWCKQNQTFSLNQERMREVQGEHQNRSVREALDTYKKNLKPIQGFKGEDGKVHITGEGSSPRDIGMGEMVDINPANYPDVKFDDLMVDGKIPEANRARAVARATNYKFLEAVKKREAENAAASRLPASTNPTPIRNYNVTLSPETFDQFLDEIWPNAATRRLRLSQSPPAEMDDTPDDRPPTRDRRPNRRFEDAQPTDRFEGPRPMIQRY